jgi:hypothetical protein
MNYAIIFLALTLLGGITMGASTYGLGKNEGDKDSGTYKASTAFSIIGASMLFIGLGGLAYKAFKECPRPLGYGNNYQGPQGPPPGPPSNYNYNQGPPGNNYNPFR